MESKFKKTLFSKLFYFNLISITFTKKTLIFFRKNKPLLRDLIPSNHIDIHSHLLPGIDDGAATIEDSISLINQMVEIGFTTIITTPHIMTNVWDNSESSINSTLSQSESVINKKCQVNTFNCAAEYMLDGYFLKRLETEKLLTFKDNHILVELSYLYPPMHLFDIIFEIQLAGYKPILAHPERYLFFHNDFQKYHQLKRQGCLFQLNLLSTVDYYGSGITKITDKLLSNNFYDFVGSDIHHQNHMDSFNKKIGVKNMASLEEAIQRNLFFIE